MKEQISLESLTGLVAFARSASLGSYSAAARALSVSPSAVSKSIQRLENQLGLKLFSRTTRSLALTSEGAELYQRALRVLQEVDEIGQLALSARSEPAGTLKLTAPLPVGIHILAPLLPEFRCRYPKISIDLRLTDQFVDLVEEGMDLAVRVGVLKDSRLLVRRLAPHRVCAFASPAYLAQRGRPERPEDLADHECVNFRYQSSGQLLRWPFQAGDRLQELLPDAPVVADVSDAVAAILVAGGGIGISPTYVAAPHVSRGELEPVLAGYAAHLSDLNALWPESRSRSPNVKAFLAFLLEKIGKVPAWDLLCDGLGPP